MTTQTRKQAQPLLEIGERLTQSVFHRRYQAYPEDVKFELIGGMVFMASPLGRLHAVYSWELNLALGLYKAYTPGTEGGQNQTTVLGEKSEPQPDLLLRILYECGGQSSYNDDDYLEGPPELVVEVAHSTRSIDMNRKRRDYLAAMVQEYLVLCVEEQVIHWFHFPSKRELKANKQGVLKSRVFPGLWIDCPSLLARDSTKLITTVQQGVASADHAEFVAKLQQRRKDQAP